ncbi:hypothetical protein LTR62_000592 [Meristemomyces frigidus]|uniref:Peptidase A1 domain-containing protein n=1 Tax=Meristemomyces frigidus TaxID=1508187 RepID=A0AAN7YC68_9PEZI|nr:hypothetical protein LTR62_000592 [Meristemomyces frigidus]
MSLSQSTLLYLATTLFQHAFAAPTNSTSVPAGAIAVPIIRGLHQLAYYAKFHVGTPPQPEYLLVDTGSPTFSFEDANDSYCKDATQPCAHYGTFDNKSSSTSIYAGTDFFDELIDFGSGVFLNDTVEIGGVSTPHLYFGYITEYGFTDQVQVPTATIAGLGLTCDGTGAKCQGAGPYLLPQLKNASSIDRIAVSVYLGPEKAANTHSEIILGAAYDEAKIDGELFTLEMVDPHSLALTNMNANNVNVTLIEAIADGKAAQHAYGPGPISQGTTYILDTGNPFWYMPKEVYNLVSSQLGNPTQQNQSTGALVVDCKYRSADNAKGKVAVHFGSAGQIDVPIHTLVTDFGGNVCNSAIGNGTSENENLGDPFLRSAYVILDQEDFTVTMGQARHTAERNVVPYPAGGFCVTSTK